ncbi:caspase family protein [Candidatus Pelagibacter sp.]|nr:caspase family protein [Candidatus Pelagibacter sp.]
MKKSGFAKGVFWTLSICIGLVGIFAVAGVVAYRGYTNASLEASYSRGDTETKIKIEKKDKLSSEIASVDKKQVKFNENLLKDKTKLNFKESGPFYGIKENGRMVRGIYKLAKNETAQTDYYGLFTKDEMFWKGYSKHTYNDGKITYQYNEYQLDSEGRVIQLDNEGNRVFKNGIFQIVDSYLITADDFEKVKKYIRYDIPIPFSFYNFDASETKIVKKETIKNNNKSAQHLKDDNIITLAKCYEIDSYPKRTYFNKFNEAKLEDKKFVVDKNNNTVTRVWLLSDKEIKKRKNKQKNVLKENVTIFEIIYIDDLIIKAKTNKKLDNVNYRNFLTINLRNNTVKSDFEGKDDFSGTWTEAQCIDKNDNINFAKKSKFITNEKYYALVIGNNNYKHLEKLDAAENDAEVIADVLTNKYGFEVDLLLNADYDTTVNSLFKITNKLKRNDNLLIYYAGHGELDKAENRGYWLPVDASFELRSKWISNQRIVDRIKATKAKHVLLIADSCFSGTLMRSGTTPDVNEAIDEKYIERLKSKKTRLVITSGGNEPVVDSDGGNHSLFALKLIDTLKNNNTVINSQILFENIRRYVVSNADQTPERALVHKTGHDGGDFLFFPKQ